MQHLHRRGSSPRTAGGRRAALPSRISCGFDHHHAVELEALHRLGAEQRHVVVAEVVHVVDARAARRRRAPRASARDSASGATTPRVVVAVPHGADLVGDGGGERRRRRHAAPPARSPSTRTLRLAVRGDPGERQQPVGDLEDRRGHAVADGEVRRPRPPAPQVRASASSQRAARRAWWTGRGRRGSSSTARAAPADAPQRDRASGPAPRRRRRGRT